MSTKLPVRSGVPQGSILGPLMFILYVNDIADNISNLSFKTLYADDAKIGREIKSMQDGVDLQSDLNIFTRWSDIWKLFFNGTKCKVLTIARSFKHNFQYHLNTIHLEYVKEFNDLGLLINSFNGTKCKVLTIARSFKHNFQYHLNTIHLEYVKEFNDLGLLINSSLTWRSHVVSKISKANIMLGLIKRTVGFNAPYRVKLHLYTTLVKPLFSYASIVYSCSKADLIQIERIQRKATKYILNNYVSEYPTRLHNTKLLL